jgi:hypothetical protein
VKRIKAYLRRCIIENGVKALTPTGQNELVAIEFQSGQLRIDYVDVPHFNRREVQLNNFTALQLLLLLLMFKGRKK